MKIDHKLKMVMLKDIKPYKRNAKAHTQEQIDFIKKMITDDDLYYNPIGIDKNNEIVVGHGRFLAMQQIDPNMEIQVFDFSDLSPKKIKELRIKDNQSQNLTGWDKDNLFAELKNIYVDIDVNYDDIIKDMGFDESLMDEMNKKESKPKEKKIKPEKKTGAVKHRYTCPFCKKSWVKGEENEI